MGRDGGGGRAYQGGQVVRPRREALGGIPRLGTKTPYLLRGDHAHETIGFGGGRDSWGKGISRWKLKKRFREGGTKKF